MMPILGPRWTWYALGVASVVGAVVLLGHRARAHRPPEAEASLNQGIVTALGFDGTTAHPFEQERQALARRRLAHQRHQGQGQQLRDVHNLAWDDTLVGLAMASSSLADASASLATDGDSATAWRGDPAAGRWEWTLPFRRVVHLGLLRAHWGDSATRGVPSSYRWEYLTAIQGKCTPEARWAVIPNGIHDDRHPNEFVHGSKTVHAQRQFLFADVDACGVRAVIEAMDGGAAPVLHELAIHESASSITRQPGIEVVASSHGPAVDPSSGAGILDGVYETLWAGEKGAGRWTIEVHLPAVHTVDRIVLVLGYDAVTVPRPRGTGRSFAGAYMPLRYSVETKPLADAQQWEAVEEAAPPIVDGNPLPVRRRLVHLREPRQVAALRMVVTEATGLWGETDAAVAAPVVRDIGLYKAGDLRPVIREPLFLSVNANPSALTHTFKGGEAYHDGRFARDVYHRLRRVIVGFDADTRWPADASRKRDAGTGRFLEAIEGDDPTLMSPLLVAMSPPPVLLLSGGSDWDFADTTAPFANKPTAWGWDPLAPATDSDRGMGQLGDALRNRRAPFIGFCGGAQILALLEAGPALQARQDTLGDGSNAYDGLLLRNDNVPIRGLAVDKRRIERAWWHDPESADSMRPSIEFDSQDPLFATLGGSDKRGVTRELPSSHYDMIRASSFSTLLTKFAVSAWSWYCKPWVSATGPEPTRDDPDRPGQRCVRIPQAFHTTDPSTYPVVGFQFHPEQRDLKRLASGSPPEARGDALNVFANAVDLAIDAYLRIYWPGS